MLGINIHNNICMRLLWMYADLLVYLLGYMLSMNKCAMRSVGSFHSLFLSTKYTQVKELRLPKISY